MTVLLARLHGNCLFPFLTRTCVSMSVLRREPEEGV